MRREWPGDPIGSGSASNNIAWVRHTGTGQPFQALGEHRRKRVDQHGGFSRHRGPPVIIQWWTISSDKPSITLGSHGLPPHQIITWWTTPRIVHDLQAIQQDATMQRQTRRDAVGFLGHCPAPLWEIWRLSTLFCMVDSKHCQIKHFKHSFKHVDSKHCQIIHTKKRI